MNTVRSLRRMGCKVNVQHFRRYFEPVMGGVTENLELQSSTFAEPHPKGGKTRVEITTPTGQIFVGTAVCRDDENYCKRTGLENCLDRLAPVAILESPPEKTLLRRFVSRRVTKV